MSVLKDSGFRQEFPSGAVRDTAEGKGRCDLLPLPQIASLLNEDAILLLIDRFEETKDTSYLRFAFESLVERYYPDMPTAIIELSRHFENGAAKYSPSNWAKFIPMRCYIDSAIRHYLKYLRGDTDENHLIACGWNLVCGWWTAENNPNDGSMETIYDVQTSEKPTRP